MIDLSSTDNFVTQWSMNAGETLYFPGLGEYIIDWGDGTQDTIIDDSVFDCEFAKHTYQNNGIYTITVSNSIARFYLNWHHYADRLLDIKQWGTAKWQSMMHAFAGATNMQMSARDTPNLYSAHFTSGMFQDAKSFNGKIGDWDVRKVYAMDNMFHGAKSFNQPIGDWDVRGVERMFGMFIKAKQFNQDLDNWLTSNVITTSLMFYGAESFNGKIGTWDMSSVQDISLMFKGAKSFNQYIGDWDVRNIDNFFRAFYEAVAFNQDISRWKVGKGKLLDEMFSYAKSFKQDLRLWQINKEASCAGMFNGAESFDPAHRCSKEPMPIIWLR